MKEPFDLIETHLSWIILTDAFAYKIKKPLNLGFQDFTTLEKRKLYCEQEILYNKPVAPQIYIEVVPLINEYAVKMHRFPQTALFSALAEQHKITADMIGLLAQQVALFHQTTTVCNPDADYGDPEILFTFMEQNFLALPENNEINAIKAWMHQKFQSHFALFLKRKAQGFIRACHGDLHLGNIVLLENKPVLFDCIEFNEHLRWIDTMNDVSFLAMDISYHHLKPLSHLFINKYVEQSQDYEGLLLLKFYQCYRAIVRAKIAHLQQLEKEQQDYLALVKNYMQSESPSLTITFGVSGVGKTFTTEQLLMNTGAIRLRSDVFRKKIADKNERYSEKSTQAVYHHLRDLAKMLLQNGYSVIIDATCLQQWQRQLFIALATELKLPFTILALHVPIDILRQRIAARGDMNVNVLALQLKTMEPLTAQEQEFCSKT